MCGMSGARGVSPGSRLTTSSAAAWSDVAGIVRAPLTPVPLSIRRLSGSTFSLDVSHGFDPALTAFECGGVGNRAGGPLDCGCLPTTRSVAV